MDEQCDSPLLDSLSPRGLPNKDLTPGWYSWVVLKWSTVISHVISLRGGVWILREGASTPSFHHFSILR